MTHAVLLLVVHGKLMRLGLNKVITVVGASPEADIRLDFPEVSRRHFRITREAKGKYVVEDLLSAAGTYLRREELDESRLEEPTTLLEHDVLRIATYDFRFVVPREDGWADLTPIAGGPTLRLADHVCTVGRTEASIVIAEAALRQATIDTYGRDSVYLIVHAEGSTVNDEKVVDARLLRDGDVISFGQVGYRFSRDAAQAHEVQGGERRLTTAVRYDPQRKLVMEITEEQAADNVAGLRRMLARVAELFDRLRNPKLARVAAAVVGVALLVFPFRVKMQTECRLAAGAVQRVRAPMSGRIDKVFVKEGDKVRKDEVLLRVVDRQLQFEKARAEKELAAAKVELERAPAKQRRAHLKEMRARIDKAHQEVERVDAFLDQSELRAGMAGRVMTPTPETLENVVVSQGQEVLEVADTKHVIIEALVPEGDIDDVVIGKPLQANFYTDMSRDYVSVVQSVVPVAEKGAVGSVVVVKAPLDNDDEKLIPGTTCVAQVSGRRHPGAVVLFKRFARMLK